MTKKSYTFEEIKQKMMDYCVYQDRCHDEVERKMRDYLLIPEAKDEILLYLMKEDFLNEERFVRSYIRGKFNIKKWGRIKILLSLKQKKISEKLIRSCFDEINDDDYRDTLRELYTSYYEKSNKKNDYQKKSTTIRYLLNKGYEYDEILSLNL